MINLDYQAINIKYIANVKTFRHYRNDSKKIYKGPTVAKCSSFKIKASPPE